MNSNSMRIGTLLVGISLAAFGCSSSTPDLGSAPEHPFAAAIRLGDPGPPPPPHIDSHAMLMWFPNRILDLFDVARLGVDIGPGVGFDGCITHYMRLAAMYRYSGGIGFETFRHPPAKYSEEQYVIPGGPELWSDGWYQDMWDVRLEAHLLIIGAHVAINIAEIGDFFAGFAFWDPRNDDY